MRFTRALRSSRWIWVSISILSSPRSKRSQMKSDSRRTVNRSDRSYRSAMAITDRKKAIAVLFAALLMLSQLTQTGIARVPSETPGKVAAEALRKGEELRRRWDLDGADREFREAASLNPSSLEAKIGQARIARVRIQYSRAIAVLKNAEMEHPSSSEIFDEYGAVYLAAEEPATARKYFLKVLSISSADSAAKIGLAGVSLLQR